mmetsp:Transcript_29246/g.62664  ORF Transcript_29246/g.62664 Transcript_29246/m.62664 type:complete len:244 (-) Transcript_29246:25-756(-)
MGACWFCPGKFQCRQLLGRWKNDGLRTLWLDGRIHTPVCQVDRFGATLWILEPAQRRLCELSGLGGIRGASHCRSSTNGRGDGHRNDRPSGGGVHDEGPGRFQSKDGGSLQSEDGPAGRRRCRRRPVGIAPDPACEHPDRLDLVVEAADVPGKRPWRSRIYGLRRDDEDPRRGGRRKRRERVLRAFDSPATRGLDRVDPRMERDSEDNETSVGRGVPTNEGEQPEVCPPGMDSRRSLLGRRER